jgi:hypothetical protein
VTTPMAGNILIVEMKLKSNHRLTDTPLLPLIRACQKERGLKSRVLKMMMKRGIPGNWANLSEWTTPIASKRRTPVPNTLKQMLKLQQELLRTK